MPSNCTRIDADLVQKTQYNIPPNQITKKPCPKPWPLPKFEPLHIDDWDDHDSPNLHRGLQAYSGAAYGASESSIKAITKYYNASTR
jgi:hypothetical protein